MLDLLLDYVISVCSLYSFLVPIVVMGIFAMTLRLALRRY